MPPLRQHSPDERARILYEETDLSPRDIARILQIGTNTFFRRVHAWGWRRRRLRVAEVDAMARTAAASRDAKLRTIGARIEDDRRSAVERAESAVLGQFNAMKAMHERVRVAAMTVVDGERAARTLLALSRALVEIDGIKRETLAAAEPLPPREPRMSKAEEADLRRRFAAMMRDFAKRQGGS